MKFRGTYILLLVALAFGAYIYFIEIKKAAKDDETKTLNEKIYGTTELDKAKAVELKNASGLITLEKASTGHWQITGPVKDAADDQTVNGMLTSLGTEKFDDTVAEGAVDLKIYGLDNPRDTLTVTLADGSKKVVKVGIDGALPGKIYLQRGDETKVLFGSSSFKTQAEKSLKDLRDKRVFKKDKTEISSIEINYLKPMSSHIALTKKDGTWQLTAPLNEKADQDAVTSFIGAIDGMRASDFASNDGSNPAEIKKYLLSTPVTTVTLNDKDGKPLSKISVSAKKGNDIYLMSNDSPVIYQMFATGADGITKKLDDFRDKKSPFEFKKDDVGEIKVKTSLTDLDLVKKATGWEQAKPEKDKVVNQVQVASLLEKFSQLKIGEFLKNETSRGLTPPQGPKGEVILLDSKGQVLNSLSWGERTKSGKTLFARTFKSGQAFYGVESSQIDALSGQTLIEAKAPPAPPVPVSLPGVAAGAPKSGGP